MHRKPLLLNFDTVMSVTLSAHGGIRAIKSTKYTCTHDFQIISTHENPLLQDYQFEYAFVYASPLHLHHSDSIL